MTPSTPVFTGSALGLLAGVITASASADSIQTRSNEVADGQIVVDFFAEGDRRLGWEGTDPYTPFDVDEIAPVLGIETVTIAHDSENFYFRLAMDAFDESNPQQSFFGAHHTIFIDADQDRSTGYIGDDGDPALTDGVFPIGADFLIQGPALFRFGNLGNPGGANQELFTWGGIIPFGQMIFDDGPVSDIEFLIPRAQLGDPESFDFFALTDTDPDFITQDTFPNLADSIDGPFFTYSTVAVVDPGLAGDFNNNGAVEQGDLDLVLGNWGASTTPSSFLANTDGLSDGVDQEELDAVLGNWGASSATSPASSSAVPEPAAFAMLAGLGLFGLRRRLAI